MAMKTRLSDSALTFIVGYASILSLYPRLVNPASMVAWYLGRSQQEGDYLPVAVDLSQVNEDIKMAFNRLVDTVQGEQEPALMGSD
jgi:hypothetical protein